MSRFDESVATRNSDFSSSVFGLRTGPNQNRTESDYLKDFEEKPKFIEKIEFSRSWFEESVATWNSDFSSSVFGLGTGPNQNRTESEYLKVF